MSQGGKDPRGSSNTTLGSTHEHSKSNSVSEGIVQTLLELLQLGAVTTALRGPSSTQTPSSEKPFPKLQLDPPLAQLCDISSEVILDKRNVIIYSSYLTKTTLMATSKSFCSKISSVT